MDKKLKFGGISFGGSKPRVTVYGKTHKLGFGRNKKEKKYGFVIKKQKRTDFFLRYFYFLFILYDLFVYFVFNPPEAVTTATKPIADTVSDVAANMGGFYVPTWGIFLLMFIYIFMIYYILYIFIFKGVKPWHGTEHKIISAAENNDLDNVKKYNPIHERCGGTLIPTMILGYVIWFIMYSTTGFMYGEMTIIVTLLFLNIKVFHKYDKVGIWFGKKFQKYCSIKEPEDWQLKLGTEGMRNLLKAEQGKEYKERDFVFDEKDIPKKKTSWKEVIPPGMIFGLLVVVMLGVATMLPLPTMNYVTDKNVTFSGETKTDYVLIQLNTSKETLPIDKIMIGMIYNSTENEIYNETVYDRLSLYFSNNNSTKIFIEEAKTKGKYKQWYITTKDYDVVPITEQALLNFTFSFDMPQGDHNESLEFNFVFVIRLTSYI